MTGWSCGACGQASPAGTRFCGFCGAAAAAAPVQTWACRACGTANLPAMVFCGGCGAKSQPERAEEMRLVTALFADLSGFTTLADTLGVEDLHDVIRPLVAGLARIAEQYGGFIEKYAGDALLVVFGAPVTHEDDAQRALLAALEMHAALPRLLSQLGPNAAHLTIHIGVNTGRVIAGRIGSEGSSDYAVLGDSVILAQRLESACPPGETYVGTSTYLLTCDEFDLESVGELVLKGKTAPVQAYRLVGRRSAATTGLRPLIGRAAELALAEEGLAQAAVTTVVGEPGAGKSRLLAELRRRATGRGVQWLSARCLSYGSSLAYWPLADLLRQELRLPLTTATDDVAGAIERTLPVAAVAGTRRLLGVDSGGLPETARREVHDAVTAWLLERSARGPVVLVVEDLHWCDRSTLEALAELVRVSAPGVALLLTTRDEGRPHAEAVAGDAPHRIVGIGPLDHAGTTAVAGGVLDGGAAVGLVGLLVEHTRGNPLHVVELARSLAESGALVETVDGWDLRPGWDLASVPTSIERVFASRLDALPPPAAAVLQLASVVGRKVRRQLLQAVHDGDDLEPALQTLTAAGMLEPDTHTGEDALTFSHALLQDVVYARLLRKHRRELHRRVADAARRIFGDGDDSIALLARHLFLADARGEAVEPLLRAGRRAAGLYANDEAAVHLSRAAQVLEQVGEQQHLAELLLELADVHQLRGAYDEALPLYERAAELTSDARAWRGRAAVLRCVGDYERALAVFVEALQRVDPKSPEAASLWLEGGLVLAGQGRPADAISTLLTGLRLLRNGDAVGRARMLTRLAHVRTTVGALDAAARDAAAAVALLEEAGSPPDLARALRVSGVVHLHRGDRLRAEAELLRGHAVAVQVRALEEAAACVLNLGLISLDEDRPKEAAERFLEALASFERIGNATGRAHAMGNVADALLRAGDGGGARAWCQRAIDLSAQMGYRLVHADALRTLAAAELLEGEPSSAAGTALQAAEELFELEAADDAREALLLAARAYDAAGEQELARQIRGRQPD